MDIRNISRTLSCEGIFYENLNDVYNLDTVAHHPHHLVLDGGHEEPGLGESPTCPLRDLLVPEVSAEMLPGEGPEPVESDQSEASIEVT